jgi:tRNA 2-selenouridine synthase
VVDVRSPAEYKQAHIPGAYSLPLFTDEERKIVGTLYKQESREKAIKAGLDFFGVKMRAMVEATEAIMIQHYNGQPNDDRRIWVHCWRGGMRSAAVSWLLDLYGFKVLTLNGGYKAYRQWVFEQFVQPYRFNILGGYTGSGKTPTLHRLKDSGVPVIDLEALALHKGSAFGGFDHQQPRQEMFENLLADALYTTSLLYPGAAIWLEDESQRIGDLNLPGTLWDTMRTSKIFFLDIPFGERLKHIVEEYAGYEKEQLIDSIIRIRKRLGGLDTKLAINCLMDNDHSGCFAILLRYYDKFYTKSLHNRADLKTQLQQIECISVAPVQNADLLYSHNIF